MNLLDPPSAADPVDPRRYHWWRTPVSHTLFFCGTVVSRMFLGPVSAFLSHRRFDDCGGLCARIVDGIYWLYSALISLSVEVQLPGVKGPWSEILSDDTEDPKSE